MLEIVFKLLKEPSAPVDVSTISPSTVVNCSISEIKSITVKHGNKALAAGDVFEIDCYNSVPQDPEAIKIIFMGTGTEKLWFVGKHMNRGTIEVHGNAGPFAGYGMKGGHLVVRGRAREWLGASMEKGTIEVYGNAEDFVGARLFFSNASGMHGGRIVIHGSARHYVGFGMLGGYIEVLGDVGDFVGLKMGGGTIVIHGSSGIYPGLEMANGLIIICRGARTIDAGFENLYQQDVPQSHCSYTLKVLTGDKLAGGTGVLFLIDRINILGSRLSRSTIK